MAKREKPTEVKSWDDVRALVNNYFIVRDFVSWRAMNDNPINHFTPSVNHVYELLLAHALYKPDKPADYGLVTLKAGETAARVESEKFDDRLTQKYLRQRTGLGVSAISNALAVLDYIDYIERKKRNGLPDIIYVTPFCWRVATWIVSGRTTYIKHRGRPYL